MAARARRTAAAACAGAGGIRDRPFWEHADEQCGDRGACQPIILPVSPSAAPIERRLFRPELGETRPGLQLRLLATLASRLDASRRSVPSIAHDERNFTPFPRPSPTASPTARSSPIRRALRLLGLLRLTAAVEGYRLHQIHLMARPDADGSMAGDSGSTSAAAASMSRSSRPSRPLRSGSRRPTGCASSPRGSAMRAGGATSAS